MFLQQNYPSHCGSKFWQEIDLLLIFYILFYLLLKTMGCFSGCLMSSASDEKLFCGVCSVFKWSFSEFVGEKVVSPSYSSAILAPSPDLLLKVFKEFPKLINCAANETFYLKEALPFSYFLKSSAIYKLLLLADQ